ncbi:SMP-30/gluconolactonase/LRE family protein [Gordonia rhizosphera]|uniref:SMP-30/Gluconolactonase/LRE-like region domain-containing protein n=1 Tax=Gordonia rhizosphera NBRC 16068 TaxID=1108045 RepID=K6V335_9ACTN|nr:SMP-30/gluconolactonase/LRE family protein [Gordonia rhizosphera]GAB90433.1 hypothetical protein GORHZ_102_00600 [Gordonia rhizosphera NBRC 16068]
MNTFEDVFGATVSTAAHRRGSGDIVKSGGWIRVFTRNRCIVIVLAVCLAFGSVVIGSVVFGSGVASAVPRSPAGTPMCAGVGPARTIVAQPHTYEAVAFDGDGRMLVTDWLGNGVDVVAHPGALPRRVATVEAPGGLAPMPDGTVLVGSGIAAPSLLAPAVGAASLIRLDPRTGARSTYATGLSMGNGVVRAPDGTLFASNDLVPAVDRIGVDVRVQRGWYRESPANGLAVSRDGRTLFANVSLGDTRILAIDTGTGRAHSYFRPPRGLDWVFFDDLDIDEHGRLYVPLYFGSQVWRIDPDGSHCALATGLTLPAGISVGAGGAGFSPSAVYVTTHAGSVVEIPHAILRR